MYYPYTLLLFDVRAKNPATERLRAITGHSGRYYALYTGHH